MNDECERMRDKMADFVLDGLDERERAALDEHAARCAECAVHFRKLQDEQTLLREFAEKVNSGMPRRKGALADAIKRCDLASRPTVAPRWRAIAPRPAAKLAAAAVLLVAVGFVAGRLMPSRPVDIEKLRAALEVSMKASLAEGIHDKLIERVGLEREEALDRHCARLKDELARQSRREMSELAEMTLAASQAATEQRLAELVRLIEAVRAVDRLQIAKAFGQVEFHRIQDRVHLGESLVSLASLNNVVTADDPERN